MPSNPRRSHRRPLPPPAAPAQRAQPAKGEDESDPQLYTPAEAAVRLRIPESWLRRRAGRRQIPCTFLGKHLRFSAADLAAIIASAAEPETGRGAGRRHPRPPRNSDLPHPRSDASITPAQTPHRTE